MGLAIVSTWITWWSWCPVPGWAGACADLLVWRSAAARLLAVVITIGQLPELIYQPKRRFASERCAAGMGPRAVPGGAGTRQQVIGIAGRCHDDPAGSSWGHSAWPSCELAADADLSGSSHAQPEDLTNRAGRFWRDPGQVLADAGFLVARDGKRHGWSDQTPQCTLDDDIVLLGMVDMNQTLRRMLDQVADRVTALVHAPPAWADRFDPYGCLDPPAWQELPIGLDTGQIRWWMSHGPGGGGA
jgi:hypothetical protein